MTPDATTRKRYFTTEFLSYSLFIFAYRPRSPSSRDLLTLFCFIVGSNDHEAFAVDISSSSTVGHLKKEIKQEIPHSLSGINANKLQLFGISVPSGPNLADRVEVAIQGAAPLNPTMEISDLFRRPLPKRTIHIAVKLPDDLGECFAFRPSIVNLRPILCPPAISTLLVKPLPHSSNYTAASR
jgi:hypothetical protein